MQSPYFFIVEPVGDRYKDAGSVEHVSQINRTAKVIATPATYIGKLEVGDTVIVHHNIFRKFLNMKGKQADGHAFLRPGLFLTAPDEIFLYKRSRWHTHRDFCFIKPIPPKEDILHKTGSSEPLTGIVQYGNDGLISYGIWEGDEVVFEPDSEHIYYIDGVKLYKMRTTDIVAVNK